jgi:integrase
MKHIVRAYLVPRFGNEIAQDIKPLDIQRWFKSLHETGGLAWTTIAKMRGVMSRICKVGIRQEHVAKNPVLRVETRSKSDYKAIVITPAQTLAILKALPSLLHFTLVLTCAATALRASEILAGVPIEDGRRFGLHNLRHSLSNWMVNKAKVEPKTVQGILRHAKIQKTLDLYTQEDGDETLVAQGEYLTALGVATQLV